MLGTITCWMVMLPGGPLDPPPEPASAMEWRRPRIPASRREAFDKWVDDRIGKLRKPQTESSAMDRAASDALAAELRQANVDWRSFLIVGEKNLEFPQMLYQVEFKERPRYFLQPANAINQWTGKLPPAVNVEPDGDIRHSSFFTHVAIASYTPRRLAEEFASFQPTGKMTITKIKEGRTSEGIWIKDETGRKYIVLFDSPFAPEMSTAAEYIGSTLVRMLGYHVPRTCITKVRGTGNPLYDGRRAVATVALKDFKGGFRYGSFRDRREIRALQLIAGWINNVDQTEQNTGMTINDAGVCRHYVIDFTASLGSFTFRPQPARLGWTRLFDPLEQFLQPLNDRGIRKVSWDAPYRVKSAAVGSFSAHYDPDRWQPFYTNMGFIEVTEEDRIWGAKLLAQVTEDQIRAVVELAGYSHPEDARYVAETLLQRRAIILRRYLGYQ